MESCGAATVGCQKEPAGPKLTVAALTAQTTIRHSCTQTVQPYISSRRGRGSVRRGESFCAKVIGCAQQSDTRSLQSWSAIACSATVKFTGSVVLMRHVGDSSSDASQRPLS